VFEVAPVWLGRNMHCPSCGSRMTARPASVEPRLRARERATPGGAGGAARLPLAVLLDNLRSLWNVGSIFRTADACAASRLVLAGITGCPPRSRIEKTALGAERAVSWTYRASAGQALAELAGEGFVPVALEASPRAVPLDEFPFPGRVALVVGNEVAGVSPEVLEACPHHVSIPMRGVKDSLNVAVAFGIAAHRAAAALEAAGRAAALALALLAAAPVLAQAAAAPPPAPAAGDVALPLTLDRVWLRLGSGAGLGKGFKSLGDLLVTAEGLEFVTRKRTVFIPSERLGVLSYGKIKGDVDTDWAVIALGQADPPELIGVRDGSKLGYGARTRSIFERLKAALKAARAGPYRVPPGLVAYEGLDDTCALAVPEGFEAAVQSIVHAGGRIPWGSVVFSAPAAAGATEAEHLARVLEGETPAFSFERAEAALSSDCGGLSAPAQAALVERARRDGLFAAGSASTPTTEPVTIDGCRGVRVLARGRRDDGREAVLELLAAARGSMQVVFGLRALSEHHAEFRRPLDAALATFRFGVAR
jgi:tRNA(Leu) C34 or U34 (ribose-2'-O)-methylase TrmL